MIYMILERIKNWNTKFDILFNFLLKNYFKEQQSSKIKGMSLKNYIKNTAKEIIIWN